jgi:hypothetical protein
MLDLDEGEIERIGVDDIVLDALSPSRSRRSVASAK